MTAARSPKHLLEIAGLRATIAGKHVLSQVDLSVDRGRVLALMGPNGSGKSSLAMTLMGDMRYVTNQPTNKPTARFEGKDLLAMTPDARARAGLYVAWQNPVAVPGVSVFSLCKASYEAHGNTIDKLTDFKSKLEMLAKQVGLTPEHITRSVHEGFSGGERKRLELLQLLLLQPKLAILDEIDSGLDIDALRTVGSIVTKMRKAGVAFILITHYKRLLEYVVPDEVNIMSHGKIVRRGGQELVAEIESKGYEHLPA